MKSIIQKSLMIALVYYAMVMIGCIKNQCNCPIPKTGKFQYAQITSMNLVYNFENNQTFSITTSNADTILKNQFGIRFLLDYETAYHQPKRFKGFAFINSALACSCAEDNFTSIDSIKHISIKTLADLDATHPAGSEVTDYFSSVFQSYTPSDIKYEKAFVGSYYDFSHQYNSNGTKGYDLYFKKNESISKTVAFELTIEYTNGKSISAKTKPVFLK